MVEYARGIFRFVLLTPNGKIADFRAGSLIFPSHDGFRGVLRNHAPMLCRLAAGIVQVKEIAGRDDAFFLIDGGFAKISENHITVLADDVTTFDGLEQDQIEHELAQARQIVVGGAYIQRQIGKTDFNKAKMLVKLGQMTGAI